jgi:hypothetical protein
LQIKNCKLRIANQELQISICKSSIALQIKNCKSRIANQELQISNCKSRIANQELQIKNCKSRIVNLEVLENCNDLLFKKMIERIFRLVKNNFQIFVHQPIISKSSFNAMQLEVENLPLLRYIHKSSGVPYISAGSYSLSL